MTIDIGIILVGGLGTRLYPLTKTRPKPLIYFIDKPIIEYQLQALKDANIKIVILCLNYFNEHLTEACIDWEKKFNMKIKLSKEDKPLDTAGPLKLAAKNFPEIYNSQGVIVMNADIYSTIKINELENYFKTLIKDNSTVCIIASYEVKDPTRYGCLLIENNKITKFLEKPKTKEEIISNKINAGIYCMSPKIIKDMIKLKKVSIEKDIFPLLAKNGNLYNYNLDGFWIDVGVPAEYLYGQRVVIEMLDLVKKNKAYSKNVILGKNVIIKENVSLSNCVIFDNTIINNNCVITNAMIGYNCIIESNVKIGNESSNVTILGDGVIVKEGVIKVISLIEPNEIINKI
ncbi:MPG1 [Hepatospora eriocheir]|uniref:mannose-1-phosphate guanylyltransferase n=1 Tax=Hepatospora eriocheir TaxID=1081669 RepID=A0A1X0QJZ7_9MICR|nr:MPG1 [Hepatospora eriocheir]